MANERILATGTIVAGGDVQWRIAPLPQPFLAGIEMGRFLYESGASRWACLNVDEEAGWNEAAELEMLQDAIEDEDYHRRGGW